MFLQMHQLLPESPDASIIFFDVCSRESYKNLPRWSLEAIQSRRASGDSENLPVVVVGNKVDKQSERSVHSKQIQFPRTQVTLQ